MTRKTHPGAAVFAATAAALAVTVLALPADTTSHTRSPRHVGTAASMDAAPVPTRSARAPRHVSETVRVASASAQTVFPHTRRPHRAATTPSEVLLTDAGSAAAEIRVSAGYN